MQIIAITGHANEGKTTTVLNLIDLLCVEAEKRNYTAKKSSYNSIKVVEIPNLKLTFAFGAAGDVASQVQENCVAAAEINADIFIQTTRTKGQGVDKLFFFAKNTHDIVQIGTVSKYFGLESQFFADDQSVSAINEIQTQNVWNLLLYILQKKYKFGGPA